MPYNLILTRMDADENEISSASLEGAHRAYLNPFTQGVDIALRQLRPEAGSNLPYRLGLELRDTAPGAPTPVPEPYFGYDGYELIVRYENIIGQTTECVSFTGAHRMILTSNHRGLDLELIPLPASADKSLRLYLSLREL
ncbi:MAG: hypothetical protein ACK58M_17180 [Acidobacteriota bacterium]|jgi:hypothetical protein|nr:hypothetical protein [Acidobacteriaceae bacterium]